MSIIHGVKRIFLLMMVSLAFCPAMNVYAQGVLGGSKVMPAAPQSHVLDDAELFRDQPERLAEIQNRLRLIEEGHGYPIYLAIYYNLFDGDLQSRADLLHKAWIGEREYGLVIVYQLDPVVSGSNPSASYFKGSVLDSHTEDGRVGAPKVGAMPGRDVELIFARVIESTEEKKTDHKVYLGAITSALEQEVTQYFELEPSKWSDANNLKLMAVFLSVIGGLVLVGFLLWKQMTRADAKSSKTRYFPAVRVGRRLGAPFGGGWISEKTFVPVSSRK
jgi:hypothetical protein